MIPLLVIVGAAVGAPLRYATDRIVQSQHDTGFPWGTFTVNVVGSFVLGVVVAGAPPAVVALVGTGFCGALTTYSTFGYETVQLATGNKLFAVFNALGSVLAGWARRAWASRSAAPKTGAGPRCRSRGLPASPRPCR